MAEPSKPLGEMLHMLEDLIGNIAEMDADEERVVVAEDLVEQAIDIRKQTEREGL